MENGSLCKCSHSNSRLLPCVSLLPKITLNTLIFILRTAT